MVKILKAISANECDFNSFYILQMTIGIDIANLLLEGHAPSAGDYNRGGGLRIEEAGDIGDVVTVTSDRAMVSPGKSVEETTDRFRHLILHGRKQVSGFACVMLYIVLLEFVLMNAYIKMVMCD